MKSIAVVAIEKEYADLLMQNISKYMNKYATFVPYSIEEINGMEILTENFVLLSTFNIFQQVKQKISSETEIIVLSLAINKKQIKILKKIPKGTKAFLANFDNRSCMHTITCIYDAGIRDYELIPYYGQEDYDKNIKIAITPNEEGYLPPNMEHIYNIGESSVDLDSLYNIADKLGVYEEFTNCEANEALKEYYYLNSIIDKLLRKKESIRKILESLLKLMNEGIIITDPNDTIYMNNEKAQKLLSHRAKILQGFHVNDIMPELDVDSTKDKLIKLPDKSITVNSLKIESRNKTAGHIVVVNESVGCAEKKPHTFFQNLHSEGHRAKYYFEDIVGKSKSMQKTIEMAKRVAFSDATVIIIGESGTGKEMFAQSIHNSSRRKKYNFVAVNCAAIPGNLLESEMFGYEEGSFTGARKGGSTGFFELADKGTIFLDEIGEMPLSLQPKLLRVLEEQLIMKVGGNRNINIDVRVICATNRNLLDMVEDGEFREDLYYRINVLPLRIPPLRQRKEDIIPSFYALAKQMNANLHLSPETVAVLKNHDWRGNVRELRNVAEFLLNCGKSYIEVEDLPLFEQRKSKTQRKEIMFDSQSIVDKFLLNEGRGIELYYSVLSELYASAARRERYGRSELTKRINKKGNLYTEGEIRRTLSVLSQYGFIMSPKGRGGSIINHSGRQLLEAIEKFRKKDAGDNR